jgi:hypothetical protein
VALQAYLEKLHCLLHINDSPLVGKGGKKKKERFYVLAFRKGSE